MRNHNRDGKITLIELFLIACIFVFGYLVIIAPISKTEDMVKEEWVQKNLHEMFEVIPTLEKSAENDADFYNKITMNEVDVVRSQWEKAPLEWPKGVQFDTFKASSNSVSIAVEFSTGVRTVTFTSSDINL